MQSYVWRILLVDDDEDDYFLTRSLLAEARQGKFQLEWAGSYERGRQALRDASFDAVLMDYDIGVRTGIELMREAIADGCRTPIILLTGRGTYEVDVEAMQAGAMDFLNKAEINAAFLERSIRYAIERRRNEYALGEANYRLEEANRALAATNAQVHASRQEQAEIVESISDSFFALDREWCFIYINRRAAQSRGREPVELIGKEIWQEFPHLVGTELEQRYRQVMETRQPVNFEWRSVVGPTTWFEISVYPSARGITVHSVDITGQKQTERSLRESQEQLRRNRDLFNLWIEATGSIIWQLGPDGQVLEPQPEYQDATGLSWEACRGWGWQNAVHAEDRPVLQEAQQRALERRTAFECELRLWNASQQAHCWYLVRGVPQFGPDGSLLAWIGAAIDVQERKQAEQALQREREMLPKLFARIPVMIIIYQIDKPGAQINEAFTRHTGWRQQDANENDLLVLCFPDPIYREEALNFMARPDSGWRTYFITTRDGGVMESSWSNLRLSEDTQIGIGIDLSEQKLAEQTLLELNALLQQQKIELEAKNQQLNGLFENAPAIMALFDAQPPYRLQTNNQVHLEFLPEPFRTNGAQGAALEEIIPTAAADGLLEIFDTVAATGKARTMYDFPINGLASGRTWWNWTLSPVKVEGKVVALAHMAINISEEVRARTDLEAERAFLQTVLDQLPLAVVIVDARDGSLLFGSQQVEKIWRHPLERLPQPGVPWSYRGFYPDGRAYQPEEQPIARTLRGEMAKEEEIIILRGDSTYGVVQVDAAPVRSPQGEILAGVAVFLDITERKRGERDTQFLIELGAILNQSVDPETLLGKICDMVGSHLDCTRCLFNEIDAEAELSIIHPDFHLGLQSAAGTFPRQNDSSDILSELRAGRPVINRDTQFDPRTASRYEEIYAVPGIRSFMAVPLLRDGSLLAALIVSDSRPRLWNDRQLTFLQAVAERTWAAYETRRLLAALRENEERFRLASRAIDGYIYDYNLATGKIIRSEGFERLTGFTAQEMADYRATWLTRIHPDDRAAHTGEAELAAAQAAGGAFSSEFRFQRADGAWITLYDQGMLIYDSAGHPARLVGITTDITQRKQMEESLRQSEASMRASEERARRLADEAQLNLQKLETVIASMKEGVLLYDPEGRLTRANPAAVALHNFSTEEAMLGQMHRSTSLFKLTQPDGELLPPSQWPVARALHGETVINQELHVLRKDTGKSWIGLNSAFPVRDRLGKVLMILETIVDITQIRQAERQRREMDALLKVQHLLVAQREQERLQIARDLHDGPIQDLIVLRFSIQSAMAMTSNSELIGILDSMQDEAQKLVHELRGVCNELRPPVLSKFGLSKAIQAHVEEVQSRSGAPRFSLALDEDDNQLTDEVRLTLYRICQESINNILRHAAAENASLRLKIEPERLLLDIQDDGQGFHLPGDWLTLAQQGHLGLVGIKERAEAIGGSVEITSAPGVGTRVLIILPRGQA